MNYEIVELEEKWISGVSIKTTNQEGKSIQDIGITWQNLFNRGVYQKIQNKVNNKTIGLYTDYVKDYTKPYLFIAGVEVSQKTEMEGVVSRMIPKGKYAKFVIEGDV